MRLVRRYRPQLILLLILVLPLVLSACGKKGGGGAWG